MAALTMSAPASAEVFAVMNNDGTGMMSSARGPGTWEVCDVSVTICGGFGSGQVISTVGAPADSVFRVTVGSSTSVSPVWRGAPVPASAPSVVGEIRGNGVVQAVPGRWTRGWDGSQQSQQLAACETRSLTGCVALTARDATCGGKTLIDKALTGRYLMVTDRNLGAGPIVLAAIRVLDPYGLPVPKAGPTVMAADAGRIGAPKHGRPKCGPAELSEAIVSRRGVVSVRCRLGCRAKVTIRQGERSVSFTKAVAARRSLKKLSVPPRKLRRVSGRVSVTVKLDGLQYAKRTLLLRPAN